MKHRSTMSRLIAVMRCAGLICAVAGSCAVTYFVALKGKPEMPNTTRVVNLNMGELDSFVDTYFPSAVKHWGIADMSKNVLSLEGPFMVVVRSERADCFIECELILLQPAPSGKYIVHFNGTPVKDSEAFRAANGLCDVWGLPKAKLTGWYNNQRHTNPLASSCLQVGRFQGHETNIDIRSGLTETASLRVLFDVEL